MLAVITLHYVFISYNMKPNTLEFMYLEREDSYTHQVGRGCKIWILNLELWDVKREGLGLLYQNLVFKVVLSCFSVFCVTKFFEQLYWTLERKYRLQLLWHMRNVV